MPVDKKRISPLELANATSPLLQESIDSNFKADRNNTKGETVQDACDNAGETNEETVTCSDNESITADIFKKTKAVNNLKKKYVDGYLGKSGMASMETGSSKGEGKLQSKAIEYGNDSEVESHEFDSNEESESSKKEYMEREGSAVRNDIEEKTASTYERLSKKQDIITNWDTEEALEEELNFIEDTKAKNLSCAGRNRTQSDLTEILGKKKLQSGKVKDQFYRIKLCPKMLMGTCRMGKHCNYAHSNEEIREATSLLKTKICSNWGQGKCYKNDCPYAHGESELRVTPDYFKTKLCKFWSRSGACPSGRSCRHAHGEKELRKRNYRHTELEKFALKSGLDVRFLLDELRLSTEFTEIKDEVLGAHVYDKEHYEKLVEKIENSRGSLFRADKSKWCGDVGKGGKRERRKGSDVLLRPRFFSFSPLITTSQDSSSKIHAQPSAVACLTSSKQGRGCGNLPPHSKESRPVRTKNQEMRGTSNKYGSSDVTETPKETEIWGSTVTLKSQQASQPNRLESETKHIESDSTLLLSKKTEVSPSVFSHASPNFYSVNAATPSTGSALASPVADLEESKRNVTTETLTPPASLLNLVYYAHHPDSVPLMQACNIDNSYAGGNFHVGIQGYESSYPHMPSLPPLPFNSTAIPQNSTVSSVPSYSCGVTYASVPEQSNQCAVPSCGHHSSGNVFPKLATSHLYDPRISQHLQNQNSHVMPSQDGHTPALRGVVDVSKIVPESSSVGGPVMYLLEADGKYRQYSLAWTPQGTVIDPLKVQTCLNSQQTHHLEKTTMDDHELPHTSAFPYCFQPGYHQHIPHHIFTPYFLHNPQSNYFQRQEMKQHPFHVEAMYRGQCDTLQSPVVVPSNSDVHTKSHISRGSQDGVINLYKVDQMQRIQLWQHPLRNPDISPSFESENRLESKKEDIARVADNTRVDVDGSFLSSDEQSIPAPS